MVPVSLEGKDLVLVSGIYVGGSQFNSTGMPSFWQKKPHLGPCPTALVLYSSRKSSFWLQHMMSHSHTNYVNVPNTLMIPFFMQPKQTLMQTKQYNTPFRASVLPHSWPCFGLLSFSLGRKPYVPHQALSSNHGISHILSYPSPFLKHPNFLSVQFIIHTRMKTWKKLFSDCCYCPHQTCGLATSQPRCLLGLAIPLSRDSSRSVLELHRSLVLVVCHHIQNFKDEGKKFADLATPVINTAVAVHDFRWKYHCKLTTDHKIAMQRWWLYSSAWIH